MEKGTGTNLVINRTLSEKGATGELQNSAKIYYNDVLKVTVSASSGYKDPKITVGDSTLVSGCDGCMEWSRIGTWT